ncbi:MAG: CBS domain-containing protein [Halobacteriaceae archaeon]
MNVADAMTPRAEVVAVSVPGTREDVLTYLQDRQFSSVPVVKETDGGEQYRGLVSRADLIDEPDEDQLALLMRDVPTVTGDQGLAAVATLMVDEGARRIPVVESGSLQGIITVTDIVRAIADGEVDGDESVGAVATSDVNTTWGGTPLVVAERELGFANVPYAVVLDDDGTMDGILTEVDVLDVARVVEGEETTGSSMAADDDDWKWESINRTGSTYLPTRNVKLPAEPVSQFMTGEVVTVTRRRTCQEAARRMLSNDIEQIPLVSGDELAGIVQDVDLLRAIV